MDARAVVLMVCGGMALLALVLSVTAQKRLARRLAQASLWLMLGAVPIAIGIDVYGLWAAAHNASSEAVLLGRTISHAMSYGAVVLPCAGLAAFALRRANSRSTR